MHLGYVYGIVERDSGKQHICIYSRSIAEKDGSLYEVKDNDLSRFEFEEERMDVLLELPFVDYFKYCQIDQKYPLQQIIDIVEEEDLKAIYDRYENDIKKEQDRLVEWDMQGKKGHRKIEEKIEGLKRRRDEFLFSHPNIVGRLST